MGTVRLVWGNATGPTRMAAYDAALSSAGIGDYNLVTVSSVIPAEVSLETVGTAPDLGPPGERLTVVQSRVDRDPDTSVGAVAGLGWVRSKDGPGLFYEASGSDPDRVKTRIEAGLAAGQELRDWDFGDPSLIIKEIPGDTDQWTTQVVCAVFGESKPLL